MVADGAACGVDEGAGEIEADLMSPVVAQRGQALDGDAVEGGGRRVVVQDRAGELAVEAVHVAGEFGEAEIDQAMQLAHAIAEVLQQPLAQAHELAQLLGRRIGQAGGRRALLGGEAGDAERIDGVGLGALEILGWRSGGCAAD